MFWVVFATVVGLFGTFDRKTITLKRMIATDLLPKPTLGCEIPYIVLHRIERDHLEDYLATQIEVDTTKREREGEGKKNPNSDRQTLSCYNFV